MQPLFRILGVGMLLGMLSGCSLLLPETSTMPTVKNPFPQLQRVAVAPFLNLSDEPTVDGRAFAQAYFAALQTTPGFEVVPLGVVEEAMIAYRINLSSPDDARRLAKALGVDAVVVGSVTDFTPYYPPRCGMRVEWYAANPGFHPIPAGYGLPWGTPEEEYIEPEIVYEAELELATAQMDTQTPLTPISSPEFYPRVPSSPVPPEPAPPAGPLAEPPATPPTTDKAADLERRRQLVTRASSDGAESAATASLAHGQYATSGTDGTIAQINPENFETGLPPDWPNPQGFIPPGPSPVRPATIPHHGPVMTHTRVYLGNDPEFTSALAAYVDFRDDARFGGWRSYLTRSDDFIRFCCHLHIVEMLSARGGASETRVVRRWSDCR